MKCGMCGAEEEKRSNRQRFCKKCRKDRKRMANTWNHMIRRCTDPGFKYYHNYGGRGITVCERWRSFDSFLADVGVIPKGLTLERIDNDGNYEPGNIRWATRVEQARNTRRNRWVPYKGEMLCFTELAERLGVNKGSLRYRINAGWSTEKAINEDVREREYLIPYKDELLNLSVWAKRLDMARSTLKYRLNNGWTVEEAFTIPVGGKRCK